MSTNGLNQGQQAAADGFFDFLFSDESELIISGPGGVGKTFLMGHLIDTIMPRYHETCRLLGIPPVYHEVMMTATTNKAAEVLGLSTGRPTKTIHSFLNLKVVTDYKTGKQRLSKTPKWTVHQNYILFVDESSMIDYQLQTYLQEGLFKSKIIYVGDHCQLAPVTETLSPIYKRNLPFFELTQPVRTSNPHLQALNEQLRETVKTGKFHPIQTVPGVIDHLDGPSMEKEVEAHFMNPSNQDRILTYTNNQVVAYNDHIRNMKGLPPTLSVGERVVNNSAIIISGRMMAVEDEFEVTEVSSSTTHKKIDTNIELEVLHCTLVGRHGTFRNVPIPVDREYFNKLLKFFAKEKNWRLYYQLKDNYPDLRPRDAATIHKAQGSTLDTVFIDVSDLSTCRRPDTAARLLYVAASRARKRIVLYGQLAKKYGGIVS